MSNQYSCGCGYNYRRSLARETSGQGSRSSQSVTPPGAWQQKTAMPERMWEPFLSPCAIAMGYVPVQAWSQPVPLCRGFQAGTIFADLDKPFCGKGGAWR